MKPFLSLCVATALSSGSLLAQSSITLRGHLLRTTDRGPIDFANVLVRSPKDSTLITGAVTDSLGGFQLSLSPGSYLLEIRALGYQPLDRPLDLSQSLDLGELLLTETSTQLHAVHVSAKRPIMLRKADRMVFDATQIAPAASSALDVLRQTPGVNVSDDGISLIGKGKVIVLINDKRIRLSGKALISLLRSYPQSDLQEIQILTTPPAKYEAEGNAGILNLKLKKVRNDYFGGSATLTGGQVSGLFSYRASTNLNYQQGKTTASLQLGAGEERFQSDLGVYRTYPAQRTSFTSDTHIEGRSKSLNLRANLDYAFTPELTLGANLSYAPSRSTPKRTNDSRDYTIAPDGTEQLARLIPGQANETSKSPYTSINLHLEKTFKGHPGRSLSWDADYVGYQNEETRDFSSTAFSPTGAPLPGTDFLLQSLVQQHTDSYLTSLDYVLPLGGSTLSFGAKGTWTRTRNSSDYDARSTVGERHDHIRFDEHIYALYSDLQHTFSPRWNLRAGLRLEYTHTAGENNGQQLTALRDYLHLFPTLYLGFTPSERHAFSLDAAIRVNRPHFSQLSSFPTYENQYSYFTGKEDLRAAKTAKLSLGYTFLGALNFQAYTNYGWDGLAQVIRLDPHTNQASYTTDNATRSLAFGLENSYVFTALPFLQSYLSQGIEYTDTRTAPAGQTLYSASGFSYNANLNNTFFLNRARTLQATLSAFYQSPSAEDGGQVSHIFSTSVGLSYSLMEGKLRLAADVYNLLASDAHVRLSTPEYQLHVQSTMQRAIVNLQLTYAFGARLKSKEARQNAQELRSRM